MMPCYMPSSLGASRVSMKPGRAAESRFTAGKLAQASLSRSAVAMQHKTGCFQGQVSSIRMWQCSSGSRGLQRISPCANQGASQSSRLCLVACASQLGTSSTLCAEAGALESTLIGTHSMSRYVCTGQAGRQQCAVQRADKDSWTGGFLCSARQHMMCNLLLCNAWARVSVSVQIYRFQDSEFAYFDNRQEAAEWAREGRVNGDESERDDLVRKSIHVVMAHCAVHALSAHAPGLPLPSATCNSQ